MKLLKLLLVLCLLNIASFFIPKALAVNGAFVQTNNLNIAREAAVAVSMQNGRVLVVGGDNFSKSAEIYDPTTETFSLTSQPNVARLYGFRATTLQDGKVLITGGIDANNNHSTNKAELYDPVTGIFTLVSSMNHSRVNHTATLLTNGKVLIAGG